MAKAPWEPPAELKITVIPADIRNGERQSSCRCPVARAVARAAGTTADEIGVAVGNKTVSVCFPQRDAIMAAYALPMTAREFIARFDRRGGELEAAFTFTATLILGEIADGDY